MIRGPRYKIDLCVQLHACTGICNTPLSLHVYRSFVYVQIVIYPLEKCAAEALIGDTIECTEYSLRIPLSYLVPDLLLTDLPPHLTVDLAQFQFNPQVGQCYMYSMQLCHVLGVGYIVHYTRTLYMALYYNDFVCGVGRVTLEC